MIARRDQNREIARAGEEKLRRERDEEIKTVRMNERVLRMVAVHSNRTVYRYDVATGSAYADFDATSNRAAPAFGVNLPESAIERGLVLPKSWDAFRGVFRDIQAGKPDGGAKLSMRTADGEPIWMDMRYSILEYAGGRPVTAALTFANITDEHEKLMVYERYRQLIEEENNREGVVWFETDLTSDVVEKMGTNVSFADFPPCGSRHMDAVNYGVENLRAEEDRAWARTYLSRERLIASFRTGVKTLSTDLPVRAPGQPDQYYRVNIQMVKDPYSGHIHAYTTLRDVTREREAEITAKRLSETDGMTGLYNKTTAEEMIREKLARPGRTPCALLIADLDDLKAINDRFGHDRGDEAIRFIASSLRAQFRRTDIVGRVGGDEFIAFLEGVGDEKKLREMIETLLGRLRAARFGPQMEQSIAGSVGIAIGVMGEDRFETLFKRADLALYFVKRNGKNGFAVYTPDMEKT